MHYVVLYYGLVKLLTYNGHTSKPVYGDFLKSNLACQATIYLIKFFYVGSGIGMTILVEQILNFVSTILYIYTVYSMQACLDIYCMTSLGILNVKVIYFLSY
jgi:hypothetical protein